MRRAEAEAIAGAGGEPARQLAVGLLEEITALRERIEELERRQSRSSQNSSMPPSQDPPMSRQQRRAEARRRARQSLRKQGGQPGHEGKTREMAPPERVDERFDHLPSPCQCGHCLSGQGSASATPSSTRSGSCRRSHR